MGSHTVEPHDSSRHSVQRQCTRSIADRHAFPAPPLCSTLAWQTDLCQPALAPIPSTRRPPSTSVDKRRQLAVDSANLWPDPAHFPPKGHYECHHHPPSRDFPSRASFTMASRPPGQVSPAAHSATARLAPSNAAARRAIPLLATDIWSIFALLLERDQNAMAPHLQSFSHRQGGRTPKLYRPRDRPEQSAPIRVPRVPPREHAITPAMAKRRSRVSQTDRPRAVIRRRIPLQNGVSAFKTIHITTRGSAKPLRAPVIVLRQTRRSLTRFHRNFCGSRFSSGVSTYNVVLTSPQATRHPGDFKLSHALPVAMASPLPVLTPPLSTDDTFRQLLRRTERILDASTSLTTRPCRGAPPFTGCPDAPPRVLPTAQRCIPLQRYSSLPMRREAIHPIGFSNPVKLATGVPIDPTLFRSVIKIPTSSQGPPDGVALPIPTLNGVKTHTPVEISTVHSHALHNSAITMDVLPGRCMPPTSFSLKGPLPWPNKQLTIMFYNCRTPV